MKRRAAVPLRHLKLAVIVSIAAASGAALGAGDPVQGAQMFRNCMACHSTEPGVNMTGPSLAGVWNRKAGSLKSFHRYSDALMSSGVVWDERTLDAWLRNPAALVPGNEMRFPGIADAAIRSNLVAYLQGVSDGKQTEATSQGGMKMNRGLPDLKAATPEARVKTIGHCDDTYTVTTVAGRTVKFWEFNLRFKTDSTDRGPRRNEPVLVPQGMQGDRAQIVFSNPEEIAKLIRSECPK